MQENPVILNGQELDGPYHLLGWFNMYVKPVSAGEDKVDIYFTISPRYLPRLETMKARTDSPDIVASFLSSNTQEFCAFSHTSNIYQILESSDKNVRDAVAKRSAKMGQLGFDLARLVLCTPDNSPTTQKRDNATVLLEHTTRRSATEYAFLTDTTPMYDRALLKVSSSTNRLYDFLTESIKETFDHTFAAKVCEKAGIRRPTVDLAQSNQSVCKL